MSMLFVNKVNLQQVSIKHQLLVEKKLLQLVEKKLLQLVLPYLGTISLQTRKKLQKSIKGVLTLKNYRLFSKVKLNSVITYSSKTLFPKFLQQAGMYPEIIWA